MSLLFNMLYRTFGQNFSFKEQASFNFMAVVTICSDIQTESLPCSQFTWALNLFYQKIVLLPSPFLPPSGSFSLFFLLFLLPPSFFSLLLFSPSPLSLYPLVTYLLRKWVVCAEEFLTFRFSRLYPCGIICFSTSCTSN